MPCKCCTQNIENVQVITVHLLSAQPVTTVLFSVVCCSWWCIGCAAVLYCALCWFYEMWNDFVARVMITSLCSVFTYTQRSSLQTSRVAHSNATCFTVERLHGYSIYLLNQVSDWRFLCKLYHACACYGSRHFYHKVWVDIKQWLAHVLSIFVYFNSTDIDTFECYFIEHRSATWSVMHDNEWMSWIRL